MYKEITHDAFFDCIESRYVEALVVRSWGTKEIASHRRHFLNRQDFADIRKPSGETLKRS